MAVNNVDPQQFGELLGMVKSIHEHTACLPELKETVARHDVELKTIKWVGRGVIGTMFAGMAAWAKTHLGVK